MMIETSSFDTMLVQGRWSPFLLSSVHLSKSLSDHLPRSELCPMEGLGGWRDALNSTLSWIQLTPQKPPVFFTRGAVSVESSAALTFLTCKCSWNRLRGLVGLQIQKSVTNGFSRECLVLSEKVWCREMLRIMSRCQNKICRIYVTV